MTIDDVAVEMRKRFTDSKGTPVTISAEEWTAMAEAIYLRDALVAIHEDPASEDTKQKVHTMLMRHRRH